MRPSPCAVTDADVGAASDVHLNIALRHPRLFGSLAFARSALTYPSVVCMMQCLSGGVGGGAGACEPDAGLTQIEESKVRHLLCLSIYLIPVDMTVSISVCCNTYLPGSLEATGHNTSDVHQR